MFRQFAARLRVHARPRRSSFGTTSVTYNRPPPNLRSSFEPKPPLDVPAPSWNPWSDNFKGSFKTKILVQTLFYAVLITQAANWVDSTLFASTENDAPKYASPSELRAAIEKLQQTFPSQEVSTQTPTLCAQSARRRILTIPPRPIPSEFKVPITPYAGATSLEGHFSGYPSGSICLDMSRMDQILQINVEDSDLICQPGVRWDDLNQTLKDKGIPLFFPIDPGPGATIGGIVATGCSGSQSTAKGEWILNLTVVLPNGEVIKTRRRARKSAAGYDMTKLFIGSEGTLGIVTEATLRLAPVLPIKVAMAQFPDVGHAVSAVQEVLNTPYGPHVQCIELLDSNMMDALNSGGLIDKPYATKDTLFFKIQGDDPTIRLASKTIQAIVKKHGSSKFEFAATDEEAESIWQGRKYALTSTLSAYPDMKLWTTDVCVPVSKLPQLVYETKKDLAAAGLTHTIVGHVGDGNFHALLLFRDDKELELVSEAVHRLIHRALSMDGTCTGEHGVGVGKKDYLVEELGQGTVDLMWRVKQAVDPQNLFNPGKLYPDKKN
ncbi:D-lactate dehydrogenase cytochrome oxidoreductase [Roridomyces roridus]|uniref:D-lactate dehydrogenase (cytochrome) n=1 Tax=Roridomyces roridus TaxID=1738132 RepID=A0AAD7B6F8_9AGAR|nr:D-lactate dehydrogenase cytochrome oxidoreductase [Roridomyces roridus]